MKISRYCGVSQSSVIENLRQEDQTSKRYSMKPRSTRLQMSISSAGPNEYKFCWTKNGAVFLRESDTSHIKRLNKLQDLITLQE